MIEKFDEEGEDSDEEDGTQVEGNYGEEKIMKVMMTMRKMVTVLSTVQIVCES